MQNSNEEKNAFRKIFGLVILIILSLILVNGFARHTIKTTLPKQILSKYQPSQNPSMVFLGSSLTDAGINSKILDSLSPQTDHFNLALAGMNGPLYYYLLIKSFLIPRGAPDLVVIEILGYTFGIPEKGFQLAGNGEKVNQILPELMSYSDLKLAYNGFPGVMNTLRFYLNKYVFIYQYRLELQSKISERLFRKSQVQIKSSAADSNAIRKNPYHMGGGAEETFERLALKELNRRKLKPIEAKKEILDSRSHFISLIELAQKNKLQLLFLRPPCPPIDRILENQPEYQKYLQNLYALCDSLGIKKMDLSKADSNSGYTFSDGIHLDEKGAKQFTLAFARALSSQTNSSPHE